MAEALAVVGLVAAIAQFVDFGTKVVDRLNEFGSDIDEMPKAFRGIQIQVPLIINTLERTQKQTGDGFISQATSDSLKPLIDGCLEQVRLLKDILDKTVPSDKASSWKRRLQALKSLAQDRKVQQITSALERYIQLLIFHQTTTNLDLGSKLPVRGASQLSSLATTPRKPLFLVPFHRDDMFVGRAEILSEIKLKLNTRQRRAALTGIGGVGKSQIAIEYCYRYKSEHPEAHVFWVHSSSITRFDQAYKEIARKLKLRGLDDPNVDILQVVAEWLSDDDNGSWLMVLDNADDQEIFFDASAQTGQQGGQQRSIALVNYLPRSSSGSIIITTRNKQVGHRLANREMPTTIFPFQAEDARQLLRTKIPRDIDWSEEESMELLEILHYLPLAITQAAGYICEEQVTLGRYLGLLRDDLDAKDVLEQDYYDPARDSEIQNSILLTWKISFDQITRQKPRAAEILSLMAVLDRQSISDFLLIKKDDRKVTFDTAMGTLKAFSLITEERRGATFGMHRLVQISIQRWLEAQQALLKWQEIALNVVSQCCPSSTEYGSWSAWETISPHIQVVLGYDIGIEPSLAQRASILTNTASYDEQQGRYGSAGEKGREALTIRQKLFGIKHPDTLTSMNILASVLHNQGKYDEAEGMHRQVSELRKQLLGNEHPDTLTSMNDLANILKSQGKYEEAERLHRQELELREKVLGKEHPHTLISMNNLALVLKSQGKYEEAERLNQHVLELTKEILGKEHPRTLISMNNLASVLQNQGKNEEAERLHRHVLELRKEVLGNEHPHTLTSMNNLASVLQNQGKNEEAERLHRQVLELRKEVSGNEHPSTLTSMNNLALVLKSQGKYEEAERLHRQVLELRKEVLGNEHPSTLTSMNNLALVLKSQGKNEEAERLHRQVLELRKEVSENEHPHTLISMNNLASVLKSQGKYENAEEIHRQELKLSKTVLGKEHPSTRKCMNNLVSVLKYLGKYEEAERVHQQV